jgi:hypothetical protein
MFGYKPKMSFPKLESSKPEEQRRFKKEIRDPHQNNPDYSGAELSR